MRINKKQINKIKELTNYNNHNLARLVLAKLINSDVHIKFYEAIDVLHTIYGHMPIELSTLRSEMESKFMNLLKHRIQNFNEVYGAL